MPSIKLHVPPLLITLLLMMPGSGSAAAVGAQRSAPSAGAGWIGVWTYDQCHEDRKPSHSKDTYCREGLDRVQITRSSAGVYDVTLCPADPWGERELRMDGSGRRLRFRTKDGLDVRLTLEGDLAHFRGVFRSRDGHAGRLWGRRVGGCG